jgi:two-component system LytT family response regulator
MPFAARIRRFAANVRRDDRRCAKVVFVDVAAIDWIESADYYACLHVGTATHILRRSLADLEDDLGDSGFARVHRSTIVNLDRIHRLALNPDGDHELELHDGTRLKLSRRHRRDVFERLRLRGGNESAMLGRPDKDLPGPR